MWSFLRHPNYYKKNLYIFFSFSIRMSRKNIKFDSKKINKSNFYESKKLFNIYDIDISKILIPKKEPYGKKRSFKYFIGYNDDGGVIRPLCIKLHQMMLNAMIVIRQCLLRLIIIIYQKSILK